jgi:cytoskeleton protein RodZ
MALIGGDLKLARENRKLSLRQASRDTRISVRFLECLEEERYSELPGGMYNRAFLRAYCQYLGLDAVQFLAHYQAQSLPVSEKSLKSKGSLQRTGRPAFRLQPLVVWAVMLCVSVAGLYLNRGWIARVFSPYFSHSPISAVNVPASTPSGLTPEPISESDTMQASANPPLHPGNDAPMPEGKLVLPPPPRLPGTIRIEFQVVEKCWVSIHSDGNRVLVKLLEPGDDQYFDAAERFFIVLGNAGGVRLKINGMPARPLGKSGEVAKVLISLQNLEEFVENGTG